LETGVAARHDYAALGLTAPDDAPGRATLVLAQANALRNAGALELGILQRALEAQVLVERFEAAARIEWMLADWYERHQASGEDQDRALLRGAEFAARGAPSEVMCLIGGARARRLINAGHSEAALALVDEMMPRVSDAGLETGRAQLLQYRGFARVHLGDTDGIADLREAAEILSDHANPSLPVVYSNLADSVRGLGDMAAADAAYETAAGWASRFALSYYSDWIAQEQSYQAYHRGDWEASQRLLGQATTSSELLDRFAGVLRGRIALGRGQLEEALADAAAYTRYASNLGVDEDFYYCEALEARCFHAQGLDAEALVTAERFLARWHGGGGFTARALELCELATVLVRHARHDEIRRAAALLPAACRWRDALISTADRRYGDAELVYAEIGSRPLTADAQLLAANAAIEDGRPADAAAHARAVRAFAEQTGATFYQHQAARFLDP
jgi:tetratricopeptide (TPR) repeat protein